MYEGPFRWHSDPMDPAVRWGALLRHYAKQGRLVDLWNLPVEGRMLTYCCFEGVTLMMFEGSGHKGAFCYIDTDDGPPHNGPDGKRQNPYDREMYQLDQMKIQGFITAEEYAEMQAETRLIRENVAEAKAGASRATARERMLLELTWIDRARAAEIHDDLLSMNLAGIPKSELRGKTSEYRELMFSVRDKQLLPDRALFGLVKVERIGYLRQCLARRSAQGLPVRGTILFEIERIRTAKDAVEYYGV